MSIRELTLGPREADRTQGLIQLVHWPAGQSPQAEE